MQTKNYSAYLKQIEHFLSGDDFKNALKHARPLIKKLPYLSLSPKKKYEVFLLLGKLYSMAGNYMASLEYFYKIRSLALKYRWSSRYLIQADYYVGIVYLDLYNPLRAIKQFNKACAYYEKYGFDGNLTKKLYIMTQVCLIQSYLKQN
ncbi:MAG: hypothetical protein KAS70_07830, partial [Planctomycetes bacterium]|nr:hypothetical protein [Planctomycetota bacterium]